MKNIAENTSSSAIASVAQPLGTTIKRNKSSSIYVGLKEADLVLDKKYKEPKPGLLTKTTESNPNPPDVVKIDIPLLIRLFEYAREDANTDMDLHVITERMIKLSSRGKTLSMRDYNKIVEQE